jgi:hypothetical protein
VIDTYIDIIVQNSAGQNLLVNTTPGFINPDSIRLQYLINDSKIDVNYANLDHPRNVFLITEPPVRIRLFPNDTKSDAYPVTYILWNSSDRDTVKCHVQRTNGGNTERVDQVWFNGVQDFPNNGIPQPGRAFTIVK